MIGPLVTNHLRTRVHADIVVITLNDHFIFAVTLMVPMSVMIVVVMMVMPRVG